MNVHDEFREIISELRVNKDPNVAVKKALDVVSREDQAVQELFSEHYEYLLSRTSHMQDWISNVISSNYYENCHRGAFIASTFALKDGDTPLLSSLTGVNTPGENLRQVCMFEEGCIRDMCLKSHFSGYDNCPARHAFENCRVGNALLDHGGKMCWIEGGAIRKNGQFVSWGIKDIRTNPEEALAKPLSYLYPCIRCLSHAQSMDVYYLTTLYLDENSEWKISFHSTPAHAGALLVLNTTTGMKE